MSRLRPQGLRSRLLVVVILGALATLTVLTAGFNFVLARRLGADADALLRARTTTQLATLSEEGRLHLGEAPDAAAVDSQTWVFDGRRAIERPRVGPMTQRAADRLAGGPQQSVTVGTDTRLHAVPLTHKGQRVGTLVSGLSLAPYQRSRRTALIASLILAALMLVAIGLAARWVIDRALRPVARMTASAAEWGHHDLDRRFGLGPARDELTELAATFDGLLDRVAASLRHEQRLTAEISHELRTPLSRILAQADLALRRQRSSSDYRDALEQIRRSGAQLRGTIDALLAAARADGSGERQVTSADALAQAVAAAWRPLAEEHDIALEVSVPAAGTLVGVASTLAERALAPLVDNGCRYARTRLSVTVERCDGHVDFVVEDDGPGVDAADRERIFEPGEHGGDGALRRGQPVGAGLGLALARRLAHAAGGDVLSEPAKRGARFRLRLPAV